MTALLVEGEEPTRERVVRLARRTGLRLDVAADGAGGLELARAHDYDAVLFDLALAGGEGPAFYGALRRERPALAQRAVALTADVSAEWVQRFLAEARCRWMLKPLDPWSLATAIGRAFAT